MFDAWLWCFTPQGEPATSHVHPPSSLTDRWCCRKVSAMRRKAWRQLYARGQGHGEMEHFDIDNVG